MDLEEKVIKEDSKYHGEIIDVYQQKVQLPDGTFANRDIVKHQNAVGILAITNSGKILLERQWRSPAQRSMIEIPAGKIDDGETAEETAIRELNEETRYRAKSLKLIGGFYSSAGFTDEYMYMYLANDLSRVDNELPKDEGENLELLEYSLSEALKAINEGIIVDSKTVIAIYYCQLNLK